MPGDPPKEGVVLKVDYLTDGRLLKLSWGSLKRFLLESGVAKEDIGSCGFTKFALVELANKFDIKLEPILDVIGNSEAVAVNQAWAGHPGRLVQSWAGPAIELKPPPAASLNTRQLWAKPVGEGAVAVLLINASPHDLDGFTLKLSALNISQPSAVRSSSSVPHTCMQLS